MAGVIGLWWTPELVRGNRDASLLRATFVLIVAAIMFYKGVVTLKRHHSPFRLFFYTALAICTVAGYLYGVFFR